MIYQTVKDGDIEVTKPVLSPETIERMLTTLFEQNARIIDMNQKIIDMLLGVSDSPHDSDQPTACQQNGQDGSNTEGQ